MNIKSRSQPKLLSLLLAVACLSVAAFAQMDNVRYAFARYDNVGALVAAGATPTRIGLALIEGSTNRFDGSGRMYVWNETSTATTNAATSGYTVLAANGVTTGRWLAVNVGWMPSLVLAATTNHIVFAATNALDAASATNSRVYVSVKISGMTNAFSLPLLGQ